MIACQCITANLIYIGNKSSSVSIKTHRISATTIFQFYRSKTKYFVVEKNGKVAKYTCRWPRGGVFLAMPINSSGGMYSNSRIIVPHQILHKGQKSLYRRTFYTLRISLIYSSGFQIVWFSQHD